VLYSKYIGENLLAFPKTADAGYDILLTTTKAKLLIAGTKIVVTGKE